MRKNKQKSPLNWAKKLEKVASIVKPIVDIIASLTRLIMIVNSYFSIN